MAARKADVLEIVVFAAGAHTFLRGRGAAVVTALEAEKNIFELVHPRIGKQQGRVVRRHQRGGVNTTVPLRLKKAQEGFPDFRTRAILHSLSLEHRWLC